MQILKNVVALELNSPPLPALIDVAAKKLAIRDIDDSPNLAVSTGLVPLSELDGEKSFYRKLPNGYSFVVAVHERAVPIAVLNDAVAKEVSEIEAEEDRKVKKKERSLIKERCYERLLPQAFVKKTNVLCVVDRKNGLVLVNSTSNKYFMAAFSLMLKMASEKESQTFHGMQTLYCEDTWFHDVCKDFTYRKLLNTDTDQSSIFEGVEPGYSVKLSEDGNTTTIKNLELSEMTSAILLALSKGQHFSEIALFINETHVRVGPNLLLKSLTFPPISDSEEDHANPFVVKLTEEMVWVAQLVKDLKKLFVPAEDDGI